MQDFRTTPSLSETFIPRAVAAVCLATILAGCAAQGNGKGIRHSEPTFMRLTEERVFAQALRQRYLELATNAYDRADFGRSDFYSLRAIMAVEGKLADPAGAGVKGAPDIDAARISLGRSLARGARTGAPDLAARAQAGYDCWWLESKPGGDTAIAEACAYNTKAVLSELDVIGTGTARATRSSEPQQYVITGDTPSQSIDAGDTRIEIARQQTAAPLAPPRPSYAEPSYEFEAAPSPLPPEPYVAPLAPLAPLPAAPREAMPAPVAAAPVPTGPSLRTFTVEPDYEDTYIPTFPIEGSYEYEYPPQGPIDLIPDYETAFPYVPPQGGQYVATESRTYETADFSAPLMEATAPPYTAPPVYMDVTSAAPASMAPPMAAPVMMDQGSDVLTTLLEARKGSASDFAVYFGFDSADITPEGRDVLEDTIERLTLNDRGTVALMGFTDSAGDSRYNQLLAMRRANAVRSYIQSRATRPVRFTIMPVGEAEAVRNGGDGVTEALNRRVEIMLR